MTKKNVLIIGAGGVAQVVAHKLAQHAQEFGELHIASRTLAKCQAIADSIAQKNAFGKDGILHIHSIDAYDTDAVADFIHQINAHIVINVGPSFVNMSVLDACIRSKACYIDTAIHEDADKVCETPPWYANHEWKRKQACEDAGITAILGMGFDPGVVNAYARLGLDFFDEDSVTDIDIIDINAGSHGKYFATNFDPEVNFREFTGVVYSWQNSAWQTNQMFEVKRVDDLPVVGKQTSYLTGHDELHSLSKHLNVPNIRFWMGFGEHYINVFNVLKNLGLLSEKPIKTAEGVEVVPLKVVKAVLPDPSSLAKDYTGKTCIGNKIQGKKDGKDASVFIYNIVDHADAFAEVGSQGISYTAGVPAVAAAILLARGQWQVNKMVNVEELDGKPLINLMNTMGIVSYIQDEDGDRLLQYEL